MATQILSIKLGACLTGPSRGLPPTLRQAGIDLNRCRNAVVRGWQRWREDHPEWQPQQRRDRKGNPKTKADGTPLLEDPMISQEMSARLYHVARAAAPHLSSNVVSQAWTAVLQRLKQRTPYNHAGEARTMWQAILAYEVQSPTYRGELIPVPNKDVVLVYDGIYRGKDPLARKLGESGCVMRFPLFSRQAGRTVITPIVRLEVGDMSRGNRRVVRRVIEGEWKLADSSIVERKGKWYLNLTYHHPGFDLGLSAGREAVLLLNDHDQQSPFLLMVPDGNPYYLGDGKLLEAEYRRLMMRRKMIRSRYKDGRNKRHGKAKFYGALKPFERTFIDLQSRILKHTLADVIKLMSRHDCGTLVYREPTPPVRDVCWFATRGIPWNWSVMEPLLRHKCEYYGMSIAKKHERMAMAEYRERYFSG